MIEFYECAEEDCYTLIDRLENGSVYCRWHWVRAKHHAIDKKQQPTKKSVIHVSERVGKCFYCGAEENLTRDHVIPKSMGKQFKRSWNTVWACEFCNRKKANKKLSEWIKEVRSNATYHPKYGQITNRSRRFVTHLLTDPSHEGIEKYRGFIDPWWG